MGSTCFCCMVVVNHLIQPYGCYDVGKVHVIGLNTVYRTSEQRHVGKIFHEVSIIVNIECI